MWGGGPCPPAGRVNSQNETSSWVSDPDARNDIVLPSRKGIVRPAPGSITLMDDMVRASGSESARTRPDSELVVAVGAADTSGMRSYGQYCPVARTSELFAERWTPI